MPTLIASTTVGPTGNVNSSSSPQVLARPTGLAAGHLLVVCEFFAQGVAGSQTAPAPANMTKVSTDGSTPTRIGAIHYAIVSDPATFASGITLNSNSTSSRVAAVAQAWAPDSGTHWDASTVIAAGPEYLGSASSSDTFPTIATRDLMLGVIMTNKSANATLTAHTAAGGGTDLTQARALSDASGTPADSVVSVTRGGTGVTFNTSQANTRADSFGISQAADSASRTATGTVTLAGTAVATVPLPAVTGNGFTSVAQMLDTPGATFAHRNLGGTYPEMTEYGVRLAANAGHGVIEISCQRTSDGVWIGSHDQTPDRVAVQTTHDGTNISSLTAAQVLAMTINVGSTGAPKPFATLEQLVETLPSDFVFMVDPKQQAATYMSEFLDLVDSLLGPTRAFIKIDGSAAKSRFEAAQARGYKTAAYFYDTTPSGTISDRMSAVDIPGLNYDADQSYWDALLAYGKPIWGHVIPNQTAYYTAISKGATFVQVTSATVTAVGVEAYAPTRTANGGVTLGGTAAARVRGAATGGVTLSGSAIVRVRATATGGVTLTGTATLRARASATGTVTVAGTAISRARLTRTATGGVTLAGSASIAGAPKTATGTVTLAGTATVRRRASATGTVSLTGTGTVRHRRASSGVLVLSGSAVIPSGLVIPTIRVLTGTAPDRTLTPTGIDRTLEGSIP